MLNISPNALKKCFTNCPLHTWLPKGNEWKLPVREENMENFKFAGDVYSPFKFLDAYDRNDKDIFFGRDKEIELLYYTTFIRLIENSWESYKIANWRLPGKKAHDSCH